MSRTIPLGGTRAGRDARPGQPAAEVLTRVRIWRSSTDSAARSAGDSSNSPIALRVRAIDGGVGLLPLAPPAPPAARSAGVDCSTSAVSAGQRRVQVVAQRHPGQRLPPVLARQPRRSSTAARRPGTARRARSRPAPPRRRPGRWLRRLHDVEQAEAVHRRRVDLLGQLLRARPRSISSATCASQRLRARRRRNSVSQLRQQRGRRRARSRAISPGTSIGERRLLTSQRTARSSSRRVSR